MIVRESGSISEVSGTVGVENANRHFMACPAQTKSSTKASDPSAYDDDVHGSGLNSHALLRLICGNE